MAFAIIRGAGLERYYEERTELPPRPEALRERWESVEAEELADGTCQVRLAVDGLRCASCVWVTENVLARTDGVEHAQVSYATGRATVRWDPERIGLQEVAGPSVTPHSTSLFRLRSTPSQGVPGLSRRFLRHMSSTAIA